MLASTLIAKVQGIIQDASFSDEDVLAYFNKCLLELADIFTFPSLISSADVAVPADADYAAMPETYYRKLFHAYNTTKDRKVHIYDSYTRFLGRFPGLDAAGPITAVCVTGNTLNVQGIPSAEETVKLHFLTAPAAIEAVGDQVTLLPASLQDELLHSFACKEAYDLIEDGMEGQKINYNKYLSRFEKAKKALGLYLDQSEEDVEGPDFIPAEQSFPALGDGDAV